MEFGHHYYGTRFTVVSMAIGDWQDEPAGKTAGIAYRNVLAEYAFSMRVLLRQVFPIHVVDELVSGFIYDLFTVRGLISTYSVFHGVRM